MARFFKEGPPEFSQTGEGKCRVSASQGAAGLEPADWKAMTDIGHGVVEFRLKERGNQYRVIYVAKFDDAVHVLHAFQEKTKKTAQPDIDLAKSWYNQIRGECNGGEIH